MRMPKPQTARKLTALFFLVAAVVALGYKTGWGTLSSFGWRGIAEICPLGALEVMAADMTLVPRVVIALVVFLGVCALLGRVFCGWMCPVPLLQWIGRRRKKEEVPVPPMRKPGDGIAADVPATPAASVAQPAGASRASSSCASCASKSCVACGSKPKGTGGEKTPYFVLGGALASSAVFGFPVFCLVCPVGLTFALVIALWRVFEFNETSWSILFFAAFLALELFVLRRWCHQFCPLGALMSLMSRINFTFRPAVNPKACLRNTAGVECRVCRDACPEGIALVGEGAGRGLSRCTKCHACSQACPVGAITFPYVRGDRFPEAAPLPVREEPVRLAPGMRLKGFSQVAEDFPVDKAERQAQRCLRCGECSSACPQGNPVSQWMGKLAEKRFDEAAELLMAPGMLPEVCGRVCPQSRLCEAACSMGGADGAVTIGAIERSAADEALRAGWKPKARRARVERRVAVVGSGPAGLACSDALARSGVHVTVYERSAALGGLLTYGIPSFKLEKSIVARRQALGEGLGVEYVTGCEVGRDIQAAELLAAYDAVFVAPGAGVPVEPNLPGETAAGVLQAKDFLAGVAETELGHRAMRGDLKGKRVVVLGGGDTAMDCARVALRLGAAHVECVCRKPQDKLRASREEIRDTLEEGGKFRCLRRVDGIAVENGRVAGVRIHGIEDGVAETVAADVVVVAYGFHAERAAWLETAGITFDGKGRILTDGDGRTANAKVFAGGDAVRGADLVVTAIADGRRSAAAILKALGVTD